MNILIVEDDFAFALDIEMYLNDLGYRDVEVTDKLKDAHHLIATKDIDLVIIDVNLNNNLSGVEFAAELQSTQAAVIFVTGLNDDKTYQAARLVKHAGFLIKPFDRVTLQSCIDRIIKLKENAKSLPEPSFVEDSFFIKQNDALRRIDCSDILWVEADGNYINIQLDGKKFVTKMSLTKMEKKFNVPYLIRAHKKFLVNIRKVDTVQSTSELLINDASIPIGPKFRSDLLKTIHQAKY